MNYPPTIQKLIDLFSKFPTVGPKTAARFVFYLLKSEQENIDELIFTISNIKRDVKTCPSCFNSFESKNKQLCAICSNPLRANTLCVVEKETDLITLEKTKQYKGRYFVLGGSISPLKKQNNEKLRIKELKNAIKENPKIAEIIIATNPTTEGEATALYLERELKDFNRKITYLAKGLPVGGEMEYADEQTLKSALEHRKEKTLS